MIWLLAHTLPLPIPSASCLFLSHPVCRRSGLLTGERGEGSGLYHHEKAWPSINHSVCYSLVQRLGKATQQGPAKKNFSYCDDILHRDDLPVPDLTILCVIGWYFFLFSIRSYFLPAFKPVLSVPTFGIDLNPCFFATVFLFRLNFNDKNLERRLAKLIVRLLATEALWVWIQTAIKNHKGAT